MNVKPLAEIGLWPADHLSALWWIGLAYRKPRQLEDESERLGRLRRGRIVATLYLHALPYALALTLLGRWILARAMGAPSLLLDLSPADLVVGIGGGIVGGIGGGIGGGIVGGILGGIVVGIGVGILGGIGVGIGGGIGGGIVFGIGEGIAVGVAFTAAFTICYFLAFLRPYYYPLHVLLVWPRRKASLYPVHPAAWDDVCCIPFLGLDHLLVDYHKLNPQHAEEEIDRWISSYLRPGQRTQALRARMILIAREAAAVPSLTLLPEIVNRLPVGDTALLAQCREVQQAARSITNLQVRLNATQRPVFREAAARELASEIRAFRGQVSGFREPLASEFGAAARAWLEIADQQLDRIRPQGGGELVRQVFRAGDPVDASGKAEAFVPRFQVLERLERQVMLSTGCPGIILYGRRRRGKSTVLRNLMGGFLPPTVRSAVISMQDPKAFTSLESFTNRVAEAADPTGNGVGTLPELFEFLGRLDARLQQKDERLILALDEYENIDNKIGEGVFSKDLLATLRESIQSHRCLTWVFAGSHELDELTHAPWSSYLVSARTVVVPSFTLDETRLLLTQPLQHSPLWEKDAPERPSFDTAFWGADGIERIHHEADGWPHLVQLIAETIVDLVNEQETPAVTPDIMGQALDEAIVRGHAVLFELMRGESQAPGEWEYLSAFRRVETQPPPEEETVFRSLRRREIMREKSGAWSLAVPLMGRWLRKRG